MTGSNEERCPSNAIIHDALCPNVQTFSWENVIIAAFEHLPVPILLFWVAWMLRDEVINLLKRLKNISVRSKFAKVFANFESANEKMSKNEGKKKEEYKTRKDCMLKRNCLLAGKNKPFICYL